jgi:hypothetical protein
MHISVLIITTEENKAIMFETNYFTKTLLFCANFLRKITKINLSDQLLCFVILCTIFHTYANLIIHKQTFHNVSRCDNSI